MSEGGGRNYRVGDGQVAVTLNMEFAVDRP